jgi:AcrR family transcriptional regulator
MGGRSATPTRERIRSAAAALFRERGYARTSVRDIAARAEADPALVIRHFGSKGQLFLDTMALTLDDEPLLDVPLEALGRRFVGFLLESAEETRAVYLALVQGSDEPEIRTRLRRVHEAAFVRPLRGRLAGEDADARARVAAALVGGLLYALWVVEDEALLAVGTAALADRYGALLQQVLTPPDAPA